MKTNFYKLLCGCLILMIAVCNLEAFAQDVNSKMAAGPDGQPGPSDDQVITMTTATGDFSWTSSGSPRWVSIYLRPLMDTYEKIRLSNIQVGFNEIPPPGASIYIETKPGSGPQGAIVRTYYSQAQIPEVVMSEEGSYQIHIRFYSTNVSTISFSYEKVAYYEFGEDVTSNGDYSFTIGKETVADGDHSFAGGYRSKSKGTYSFAIGAYSSANGYSSLAAGYGSVTNSSYSFATGYYTRAGYAALSSGWRALSNAHISMAQGYETQSNSYSAAVFGRYNVGSTSADKYNWVDSNTIFEIGIGSSANARENAFTVLKNGKIGIGEEMHSDAQMAGDYKLFVNGGIKSTAVRVMQAPWADFVFEKEYKLRSLAEVKSYIEENKRLPDMPSAEQVGEEGVDLAEVNAKLLQKIEELTLYLLEQEDRIKQLESRLK
ncbi:hypothetical protein [Aureibacter tunicatorum]|uniref:Trimeric autotransporter adhesin YadA-like head domain-containing protein n=1 Tax=Aureibacter tunicatorum TaxID=866807 RepID=A0AAE3XPY6_9BACT|nr:hypothetical protein [Aureibacter tunicatorum]MDR6240470.1 hypothetical protein [Aureibacter tunicatorum]BDD05651.1 hypothetical protein AUTU_31340 [Aureibacter tunicatorum]